LKITPANQLTHGVEPGGRVAESALCQLGSQLGLGDATQAAIAKRLGPDRAAAIRGDAWSRRREFAVCPDPK
jgi:hypothetical protein